MGDTRSGGVMGRSLFRGKEDVRSSAVGDRCAKMEEVGDRCSGKMEG